LRNRFRFDLPPQAANHDINAAVEGFRSAAADRIEELITAQRAPAAPEQRAEKRKLAACERYLATFCS
jgi:hypothetical protein